LGLQDLEEAVDLKADYALACLVRSKAKNGV